MTQRRTGNETQNRDNDIAYCDLEKAVPSSPGLAVKTDLLKHDTLVQIYTVKPVGQIRKSNQRAMYDKPTLCQAKTSKWTFPVTAWHAAIERNT
jgi:hypothetical protein